MRMISSFLILILETNLIFARQVNNTCQFFVGQIIEGNEGNYPDCKNCWDWYNEHIQYKVWFPRCGKTYDNEYQFQIRDKSQRQSMTNCMKHFLMPGNSNCEHLAKQSRNYCLNRGRVCHGMPDAK